ncbi:hypothetical protein GCM10027200_50880 [Lentzea nigeriaca]
MCPQKARTTSPFECFLGAEPPDPSRGYAPGPRLGSTTLDDRLFVLSPCRNLYTGYGFGVLGDLARGIALGFVGVRGRGVARWGLVHKGRRSLEDCPQLPFA